MNFIVIGVFIFLGSVIGIEGILYLYRKVRSTQKNKIKKRLKKYTFVENEMGNILKKRKLSDIPALNNFLLSLPIVSGLDQLTLQANTKYPLGVYLISTPLLGAAGYLVGLFLLHSKALAVAMGLPMMMLPYLYLVFFEKPQNQ